MLTIAMLMAVLVFSVVVMMLISDLKGVIKMEKIRTVVRLKKRLKWASFLASFSELKIP